MSTKIWTSKADFDSGTTHFNVVDYRVSGEVQLSCGWTVGGTLIKARRFNAAAGTSASGLTFGGYPNPGDGLLATNTTEEYSGTSWCTGGTLSQAGGELAGCGTQTAAVAFGGDRSVGGGSSYSKRTETYNGTTWTSKGDLLITGRRDLGGVGTKTAALAFGGNTGAVSKKTEHWNDILWTADNDLLVAKKDVSGAGTSTAALCIGGYTTTYVNNTEEFNGTAWCTGGNLNYTSYRHGSGGTWTSAWVAGGWDALNSYSSKAEEYDGTSWYVSLPLNYQRRELAGAGLVDSGLVCGGLDTGSVVLSSTEERYYVGSGVWDGDFDSGVVNVYWDQLFWTNTGGSVKARVKSADTQSDLGGVWSVGGSLNTARRNLAGCGTQDAGLSFGGYVSAVSAITEEYNGSSWCTAGNLNTARQSLAGCGTQTAGLSFGGTTGTVSAVTEEYNGVSWTIAGVGILNIARQQLAGCGTQSAGLSFGGTTGTVSAVTEEYNGSSWCSAGNLLTIRQGLAGAGTQIAALSFGGYAVVVKNTTEEYNGSSWCTAGNLNTAKRLLAGCGTQIAGLAFGGQYCTQDYTVLGVSEEYDGTSWSEVGVGLSQARRSLAGAGDQGSGLAFGGYTATANVTTTEEYNGGTSTWYPIGDYYTTQPIAVDCPNKRWIRVEMVLLEGSTPQLQQIEQGWSLYDTISGNARISPIISANASIVIWGKIYATGRISPIISANANVVYRIDTTARIRPSISSNANVVQSINALARVRPSIGINGRIRPVITSVSRIRPSMDSNARIRPRILANANVVYRIDTNARIRPRILANANVVYRIDTNARIRPSISAVASVHAFKKLDSNARIRPRILANANIVYTIDANARIQPNISSNGRIRPSIFAVARISPSLFSLARIQPRISANAYISYPIFASGRVRPSISAVAYIVDVYEQTINACARVMADRRTRLYISSDVKENVLLYSSYQELRGLVVDENFYTKYGHCIPRKRGRTRFGKYLFALQSPQHAETVWSLSLNSSYQYHILTDEVGIVPFRLALPRGQNRIDLTREETDVQLLEIDPSTRTNIFPFNTTSSMKQEETFIVRDLYGQKIKLQNTDYVFLDTKYIKLIPSAYNASATYTIYYVVIRAGQTEPEKRTYTTWVRSLNYLTWFAGYSEELDIIDKEADEVKGNTYLKTATHEGLEYNFGEVLARTEPDSTWGVEAYRDILEEYYHVYLRSSTTIKGLKESIGIIATIPPKIMSYRDYKKWILGWQWLPNRNLIVNSLSGLPDEWVVTGGACSNTGTPLYGDNLLEVVADGIGDVVIESQAIHTWKRFVSRLWNLNGWLKKDSGPTLSMKLFMSEDGGLTWYAGAGASLTNSWKRLSFERRITKYATDLRVRFVIYSPPTGRKIYLNWPCLLENIDKCLYVGASSYVTENNWISATYVNNYTFKLAGNYQDTFTYLKKIEMDCGTDGSRYVKVSSSSYSDSTGYTTVIVMIKLNAVPPGVVTTNLRNVRFQVDPVYWSTVPRSKAKSYHGFRVSCWGIHTLTEHEKYLVGFKTEDGENIMNPAAGHPYWIKSAESIIELVEEDDYRVFSSYATLKTGQRINMEVVKREDVEDV